MSDHSWEHPVLGFISPTDYFWKSTVQLPAFRAFEYSCGSEQQRESWTWLLFEGEDRPSEAAVEFAVRIVEIQETLADRVRLAMWDELAGTGPNSGMWWHGQLEQINADEVAFTRPGDEPATIREPTDLNRHLGVPQVVIRDTVYGVDGLVAEVAFASTFDVEHGVGVLDDGTAVIGIGYQTDALPFNVGE